MKYYVVADVHGFYTETVAALEAAGFFGETEPCKLIVCGDMLDRGEEALKMVDFMLEMQKEGKLIYICGNHEDLLVDCLQEISRGEIYDIACGMSHHYRNRTWHTLLQLSGMSPNEAINRPHALVATVMQSDYYRKLLRNTVDFFETDNYVFVHGWLPCKITGFRPLYEYAYDPDWREAEYEDLKRSRWLNGMEMACKHGILEPEKTVVCGHYHTSYGHAVLRKRCTEYGDDADFSPFYGKGIIAIDACTAHSGKVNCIVIED